MCAVVSSCSFFCATHAPGTPRGVRRDHGEGPYVKGICRLRIEGCSGARDNVGMFTATSNVSSTKRGAQRRRGGRTISRMYSDLLMSFEGPTQPWSPASCGHEGLACQQRGTTRVLTLAKTQKQVALANLTPVFAGA